MSWDFLAVLLIILLYGLMMLFSASYSTGYYRWKGDIYHFIRPQVIYAIIGLALMWVLSNIKYTVWKNIWVHLYIVTILLLIIALFSPEQNGCHRWVYIFGPSLQPSELAKLVAIIWIASSTDRYFEKRKTLYYGIVRPLLPLILIFVLLYFEPHYSAMILMVMIVFTMLICGGCGLRWMPAVIAGGLIVGWIFLSTRVGYIEERLGAWNLFSSASEAGETETLYQTQQSLYAIASGGLTGLGIGNSRQKHLWLPEVTNDFIFPVMCEELGFIGAVLCIGLFAWLILSGIAIALRSPDYFGAMLGIGIMAQVAWQVFCNIGVVTDTLPNTGISLPFFSSGGTSLIMLLAEMGIVLSVSRAGNAAQAEQRRRSHEELTRRMQKTSEKSVYRRKEQRQEEKD